MELHHSKDHLAHMTRNNRRKEQGLLKTHGKGKDLLRETKAKKGMKSKEKECPALQLDHYQRWEKNSEKEGSMTNQSQHSALYVKVATKNTSAKDSQTCLNPLLTGGGTASPRCYAWGVSSTRVGGVGSAGSPAVSSSTERGHQWTWGAGGARTGRPSGGRPGESTTDSVSALSKGPGNETRVQKALLKLWFCEIYWLFFYF